MSYHLAQVNIARMKEPLDSQLLSTFVARLDEINSLADNAPGFVWRLQDYGNADATSIRVYEDDLILVNLSVWESPEHLRNFVYKTMHVEVMKQRRTWFERMDRLYYSLWWIETGHIPSPAEAKAKLELINQRGPISEAFDFSQLFPAPN
jgi:hypothetical protein